MANKKSQLIKLDSLPYHQIGILIAIFKSYIRKECRRPHDSYVSNLFSSPRISVPKDFGPTLSQKGMSNVMCQLLNATINYLQIM